MKLTAQRERELTDRAQTGRASIQSSEVFSPASSATPAELELDHEVRSQLAGAGGDGGVHRWGDAGKWPGLPCPQSCGQAQPSVGELH